MNPKVDAHWTQVQTHLKAIDPSVITRVRHYTPRLVQRGFYRDIAIHEASHAVTALAFGLPVEMVHVDFERDCGVAAGHVIEDLDSYFDDDQTIERDGDSLLPFDQLASAAISLSLSGLIGEAIHSAGDIPWHWLLWDDHASDHKKASAWTKCDKTLLACQQATIDVLLERWGLVEKIAHALWSSETLYSDDIQSICGDA